MVQGENTTVIEYQLAPLLAFPDYHSTAHENGALNPAVRSVPVLRDGRRMPAAQTSTSRTTAPRSGQPASGTAQQGRAANPLTGSTEPAGDQVVDAKSATYTHSTGPTEPA